MIIVNNGKNVKGSRLRFGEGRFSILLLGAFIHPCGYSNNRKQHCIIKDNLELGTLQSSKRDRKELIWNTCHGPANCGLAVL